MKEAVYSFSNSAGDKFYLRLGKLNVSVIDTPIYIDACGNDVYFHLKSREIHADIAEIISKDIHKGFDK